MSEYSLHNIIEEAAVAYQTSPEMNMVELARRGISKTSLLKLAELSSISLKELSALLPVSLRTIQRYKDDELLEPALSEHALLIAEVIARAMDVFNNKKKMQQWLHTPSIGLGHQTPLSLLDTSFGARMVTNELGRLEHGLFS